MKKTAVFATILVIANPAMAECDLSRVVGYTLIAEKTVSGRIDNGQQETGYEGCQYDRVLVFSDNTGVRCSSYNYQYAFNPTAFIFGTGYSLLACIDGEFVEVRKL